MVFFIRTATERDIAALVSLLASAWRATYLDLYGAERVEHFISEWHSPNAVAANIARTDGEYLVADSGSRLGGMAFASLSGEGDEKVVKLHQLYVHPDCQRQGIGRDLFAEIETCFIDVKRMVLEVDPGNHHAINFYKGVGMEEVGRTANCGPGKSGIPALIYAKGLPAA